jgi:MGT family glycosyltransferase
MLPGVREAISDFGPSVVVADQHALAGALAARRAGVPWATTAPTASLLDDSLERVPKVRRWLVDLLAELQREAGVEPVEWPDRSPDLVLLFTTPALAGTARRPAAWRFVGPALDGRPEPSAFPWAALAEGPRLYVTLGTVTVVRGARFLETLFEALDGAGLQVVLAAPSEVVASPPPNVLVRPYVPQLALLAHMDAVVCHAGHTTVCDALAHGLPLVVAPVNWDQPTVAGQVAAAGAGIRVSFTRASLAELRSAVESVLVDGSYRRAAERIRESFRAAGGSAAAATLLEQAAARRAA